MVNTVKKKLFVIVFIFIAAGSLTLFLTGNTSTVSDPEVIVPSTFSPSDDIPSTDTLSPQSTSPDTPKQTSTQLAKSNIPADPKIDVKKKFNFPALVFKGKVLKRDELTSYDRLFLDGKEIKSELIPIQRTGDVEIEVIKEGYIYKTTIYSINGWLTIIPPVIAIALALIFKDVVVALFLGIFSGALLIDHFNPFTAFFDTLDRYIVDAITDKDRASIILFTLLLGGMVGIITKSGGFRGIVEALSTKVKSPGSTQFYTWLMGIFIFFDDYTNTLIVGNTMRPLSDKWKVSREKLAYIVDSTAAPIASLAIISTWIGFEISLINESLKAYNVNSDAFHLFLSSLPYRFYPLLGLIFVFLTFSLKRDFGPMLKAENRARKGKLLKDSAVPLSDFESSGLTPGDSVKARWFNGLVPITVVIVSTFIGLYRSGMVNLVRDGNPVGDMPFWQLIFSSSVVKNLGTVVSSADSFKVLLWASLLGVFATMILASLQRILKLREMIESFVLGMKSMLMAIVILVLAWSLGVVLGELHTADYLVSLLSSHLDYHLFPALVFIFSGVIAFSTGTSWGTISIMYPLVIPFIVVLTKTSGNMEQFLVLTISSVLAGAVFGDHCSPISDTTIMSSMASSCDHIDHVKTQLPYAFSIAMISLIIGILPVSYGFPYILSFLLSITICILLLLIIGKKPIDD